MRRLIWAPVLALLGAASVTTTVFLPTGWHIVPPSGPMHATGIFPHGIALSPRGARLAVVQSGDAPPALLLFDARTLALRRSVSLAGAFGRPVWLDGERVVVAGANDDALAVVNAGNGVVEHIALPAGSWPAQVALSPDRRFFATSNDGNGSISIGRISRGAVALIPVGAHPSDLLFSPDGRRIYVALRGESRVAVVNVANHDVDGIAVGLHPDALAFSKDGTLLYVAESDDDALGIVDLRTRTRIADVDLRLNDGRTSGYGASPNALAVGPRSVYISLGAENAVAVVRDRKLVGRIPTGWYPSGIALGTAARLYVSDAKGESSPANPNFNPYIPGHGNGYVGSSLDGSIRIVEAHALDTPAVIANASQDWVAPRHTILRAGGPIEHVIYIIKENRTYDQVLGGVAGADGDPALVWFGAQITPNQHAIARRFGVFDRTFADAQVSADGHNWSTAAFSNDYLERFWPQVYAGRRNVYDFEDGAVASTPHNGYLWDDAARAGITYRDYGEFVTNPANANAPVTSHMPHLIHHIDPHYPGFDLEISDQVRYEEWKREFDAYVANDDLPQLEIVRLPNDHTMGTRPGALTPQAYVAQNDYAFGEIVSAASHSPYWASTAIFAIEDDAQDGPDHVDDQRTTLYVASPYALPGTHHTTYTTASVLHTVELLLGLQPMSIYDAVAPPLYGAFGFRPVLRPFDAIAPRTDVNARNSRTAYGAATSMTLDFRHADRVDPKVLNDILAHAVKAKPR